MAVEDGLPPVTFTEEPLPSLPDWVPPADSGQPSPTEINVLARESRSTFAAANTSIPIVYGRDRLFGQPFVIHVSGKFLYVAYGICEGEIESYETILIDGVDINDGDEGFLLNSGAKVTEYLGTAAQGPDPDLSAKVPNYSDGNPNLAYLVIKAPEDSTRGFPKVEAIITGRNVYDPRKDSTRTEITPPGSGAHRDDNPTTWEYSDTPALCFADFATQFVGWPVLWQGVADNADDCEELISGEKRRIVGLSLIRPSKAEQWTKVWRMYMSAYITWEGGSIRVIPDKKDVIGQGSILLDGSAGGEVSVGNEAILDFNDVEDFTIEASVNPFVLEDGKGIVSKKNIIGGGSDAGYAMYTRADGAVRVQVNDGTNNVSANFIDVLTAGSWSTLAARISRTDDEINLFVDGSPHAANPISIASVTGSLSNSNNFIIGNDDGGASEINGRIDEVRVWNDQRTSDEILANYTLELCVPLQQTGLIGYWRLNDNVGQTAFDHSVQVNNGTLAGEATWGVGRLEIIPDGIAMHITSDDVKHNSLSLKKRGLRDAPNSVVIEYRDGSDPLNWRTLREQIETQGVISGADIRRLSRISLPGIKRASQARREAVKRLNWFISDLEGKLTLFDEGLKIQQGSIVAVTHPIGLTAKLFRVTRTTAVGGRWTLDLSEYDQNIYSDEVIADPTLPDTQLGNPLIAPDIVGLTASEELFEYKNGNTGSRIRASWDAPTNAFVSQFVVEGFVKGARVFQTVTTNTEVITSPVEELITSTTAVEYEIRVAAQTAFTIGTFATFDVTVQGKLAIPGNVPQVTGVQIEADQVALSWQQATDIDIWRYDVRLGSTSDTFDTAVQQELVDGLNYIVTGIPLGTHRFFVKAIDSVRNVSAAAATVDLTLLAPDPVTTLSGFEVASEVRLSWQAVTTGFVARYRIAYSDIPETFETDLDVVDTLRFQTKDVAEGTFTFKVFAQDRAGNEAAADTVEIEVTSDADAFLADTHTFVSPSLTNMTVWQTREFPNDGKKFYTTDMGEVFDSGPAPHDFVAGVPVATYHTAGASKWESEEHDFGILLTGSWVFTSDITALSGIFTTLFELSTDSVVWDTFTAATKGTYRYARMVVETSATPGTATVFVISPPMGVSVTVVPLEESGNSTSLSSGGDTIVLTREYIALKEITTQPINLQTGQTSVVDNIVIGPNTSVSSDGTNYLDGGDVAAFDFGATQDFSCEFWVQHSGGTGLKRLVGKRNAAAEGWNIDIDETTFEISVTIEDTSANTITHTTAGDAIPNDGTQYHVGVAVDRTGDTIGIHIDGVLNNGTGDISTVTATLATTAAFRTHANSAAAEVFDGQIDELRLWDDKRTAAEFLANKDAEISATSTNLIGYWKMDGPVSTAVTTVQDSHANNNDLTDTGAGATTFTDPGEVGNIIKKVNSFDVYVFDIFGTQQATEYQWKWKAV